MSEPTTKELLLNVLRQIDHHLDMGMGVRRHQVADAIALASGLPDTCGAHEPTEAMCNAADEAIVNDRRFEKYATMPDEGWSLVYRAMEAARVASAESAGRWSDDDPFGPEAGDIGGSLPPPPDAGEGGEG